MYVRPVRRICDVRGCKNKDCFSISKMREAGFSVIICKSCLGQALAELDEPDVVKATKMMAESTLSRLYANNKPVKPTEPKAEGLEEGQKAEDTTNTSDEEGEGVKVVPNGEVENLVAPSDAPEEEKPKAKKRTTKKGEK